MGVRPNIIFEDVKPKLEAGFKNIGLIDPVIDLYNAPFVGAPQVPPALSKGDSWMEFSLSLSVMDMIGKNDIENYNKLLKDVNKITRAMVALVKIMRILSSDLKSINRALKFVIKQIAITLKDLIESFMSTGMYYTVLRPKQSENDLGYIVPTWGDFDEFKTVIINACTDYNDKGSPSQLNLDAQVGGFVIGGVAGSNTPQAIDYIYHNMGILANLFNFKHSLPGPPKNVIALASIYDEKPGIKIIWNRSDSFIIGGFYIYRTEIKGGSFLTENQMEVVIESSLLAKDPNQVRNFQKIKIFDNSKPFNKSTEKPVFIKYSPFIDKYSYVDADIEEGKRYYYKVYTVLQKSGDGLTANPYLFRVDSPLASNEASAVSYSCIPVSEITKGILTLDGDWVDEKVYAKSKWESVSLKSLLGSQIDKLLRNVESFADKLIGYVSTSTDAINEYLNFFSNKISDYIKIINIINQVINILMNFRLKGSILLLNLTDVKKGGIQGFCERVAKAPINSAILGKMPRSEKEIINGPTTGTVINERMSNDMGQSLAQLKGIYYGLVVVYGVGNPSNYKAYSAPYMEEYNDVVRQLNDSQRSINMLLNILLGKG